MLKYERTIDLNGKWEFVPGYLKCENIYNYIFDCPHTGWQEIDVPYFWNGSRWMSILGEFHMKNGCYKDGRVPPFKGHNGVGWYRKKICLPGQWAGKRIHIRFLAVAAKAKVWVNGHEAGEHLGAYSSFEFDITDFVSCTEENSIVVQVWGKKCFYPDDQRSYDQGGIHLFVPGRQQDIPVGETRDNAGIYQPVEIFATEKAYVNDVEAALCGDTVKIKVHAIRKYVKPETITVKVMIRDRKTGRVIWEEARDSRLPEEHNTLTFLAKQPDIKLWSPENPAMYSIEAGLSCKGSDWGTVYKESGFKVFEIRNSKFYLNGKPYFLRGAGSPVSPVIIHDEEYIFKFLKMCKELNLNCIRFHTEPPSQIWLKGCDELGLLSIYEMPLMQQLPEIVNTRREFRELVRHVKHHPSIAIYCLSNETEFYPGAGRMIGYETVAAYLGDLRAAVLEVDDTLPVYHNAGYSGEVEGGNGDIRDWHIYGGWYGSCIYSYEAVVRGIAEMEMLQPEEGRPMAPEGLTDKIKMRFLRDVHKPVILTEFIAAYTADDGHLFQYPLKVRRIGKYRDEGNKRSLWYQAFLLKEVVEILRRERNGTNNLSGLTPFALFNWFFNPLDKDRLSLKPAALALKGVMEPAHASIRCWNRHKFGRDEFEAWIYLINDDAARGDIEKSVLKYSIRTENGEVISEGSICVEELDYYDIKVVPVRIDLPDITGREIREAVMDVEWKTGEEMLSHNTVDLLLAPAGLKIFNKDGISGKVYLFDTEGSTAALFDRMNLAYERVESISEASGMNLAVIIGANSLGKLTGNDKALLNQGMNRGLTVLVLEQDVYDINRQDISIDWIDGTPLRIMREGGQVDDFVYVTDFNSPIFKGLKPEHFRMWNGNTVVVSSYIRQGTDENHVPAKTLFGSRSGYGVSKLDNVKSFIECFNFLRNDGLIEVQCGAGRVLFSQLEASRRYGDDPVATVYMNNLFKYALE